MVTPESRPTSVFEAAPEVHEGEKPTLNAIQAAPPSEPPSPGTDERVDRLLAENLALMKERKALIEVADHRANRGRELIDETRLGRRLVKAYATANTRHEVTGNADDRQTRDVALEALRDWADKTI